MSNLKNLSGLALLILQYVRYRLGRCKPPEVQRYYDQGLTALAFLFGWWRKTRIVGAEHCPHTGPAIFAGNHVLMDDPFVLGNVIFRLSGRRIRPYVMMRDDFFKGLPKWVKKVIDPDEVARLIGAIQVSREGAEPSQLLPFVAVLQQGDVFLIYPGRTRSRSGLFMEYRDWIRSPGATAFFLAKAQEEQPELRVPTIPVARTYNPVTKRSTLVFGEALYLPPGADRPAQREFDYRLIVAMSDLVEVNVPQAVSALLYLRALHGRGDTLAIPSLCASIQRVFSEIAPRHTDPSALDDTEHEVRRTLRFLQSKRMLHLRRNRIRLNRTAVLAVPPSLSRYNEANPIKYLANQILHLPDVIRVMERGFFQTVGGVEGIERKD